MLQYFMQYVVFALLTPSGMTVKMEVLLVT